MEESGSSRLYSGPLSQAAQKILAVLRAQSLRRNQSPYSQRQMMERYYGSQRGPLAQSSRILSQDERRDGPQVSPYNDSSIQRQSYQPPQTPACTLSSRASSCSSSCWEPSQTEAYYQRSQIYSHRKYSDSTASQCSPSLHLPQREAGETAASHPNRDRYTLCPQVPERQFEATAWRNAPEEIRPPFIQTPSGDDRVPDEASSPSMEHPNNHEPSLARHPLSSWLRMSEETDGNASKECCNIPRNELEDRKLPLLNLAEEDALHLQPQSETIKPGGRDLLLAGSVTRQETCCDSPRLMRPLSREEGVALMVDSERMTYEAGEGQNPNKEHDVQDGVAWKDTDVSKNTSYSSSIMLVEKKESDLKDGCRARSSENFWMPSGRTSQAVNTQDSWCHAGNPLVNPDTGPIPCDNMTDRVEGTSVTEARKTETGSDTSTGNKVEAEEPPKSDVSELPGREAETGGGERESDESAMRPVTSDECSPTGGDAAALARERGANQAGFRAPSLQHDGAQIRGSVAPISTFALGRNLDKKLENPNHFRPLSLKRKLEIPEHQNARPPPKIYRLPRWKPPHSSRNTELKPKISIPEPQTTGRLSEEDSSRKKGKSCAESAAKQTSVTCPPLKHKQAKCGPEPNGPKTSHKGDTGCLTATLTSDPRVTDTGKLSPDEKAEVLQKAAKAEALVLTLVYRDGTTQLDPEQKLAPSACGLLVLMKSDLECSTPEDSLVPNDSLVYLKLEHTPAWVQQLTHQSPELFARDMLLHVLSTSQLVVCFKAKDLLRAALQLYKPDLSWKQVAGCQIQDPQVSGWLLDPASPCSCYQDLLNKHCKRPRATSALGAKKVSEVISGLYSLYRLNVNLCSKLQIQGLWEMYHNIELSMISVLAAMESHHIHVDKEALRRTSDLLGTKMKQLEQEAHRAAGQIFLVTSSTQLRTVLFEKLCLHERCANKKLPKTVSKQQQSTSEAALLQLQDLHPLPKIILEYRQVHKIKSTFVDGILSCMMSKSYISSTWHQTSAVTGRISAKHPNFQALPRQPLHITKKQYVHGKEEEVVSVHPRAMFVPQEGWTFLAADFCQVELRLLAHLSSDPELLRVFTRPQADVFTTLASQWKGVCEGDVTPEDREHAKRIVYSVVYGAGRERLSGILGVSAEQASRFQDSFLQTYREVQTFIQRTIQQCHKRGYVLSVMGRRRTLPNISSPDWAVRMQAERQAVNFVVQGSAADLCKMAMIRIFNLVSSSSSLSARLIAQLHDELLYEVEDSQVEQFAALVRSTMESLQHIDHLGVHLKVPLRVAVSSGKSWGSMSELSIPSASPSL